MQEAGRQGRHGVMRGSCTWNCAGGLVVPTGGCAWRSLKLLLVAVPGDP